MLAPITATTFTNVADFQQTESWDDSPLAEPLDERIDGAVPMAGIVGAGAASQPLVDGMWHQYLYWWAWLEWILEGFPVPPKDPPVEPPEPPPGYPPPPPDPVPDPPPGGWGGWPPGGVPDPLPPREEPSSIRGRFNPNQWTIWDQIDNMTNPLLGSFPFIGVEPPFQSVIGEGGMLVSTASGFPLHTIVGWAEQIAAEAGFKLTTKRCCVVPGFPKVTASPSSSSDVFSWSTRTVVRLRDDAECSCKCCDVRQYISFSASSVKSDKSKTSFDYAKLIKQYRSKEDKRVFIKYPWDIRAAMQHDSGRWYLRQTESFERDLTPRYRYWLEDIQWAVSHVRPEARTDTVDAVGLATEYLHPKDERVFGALPLSAFEENNVADRYGARPGERGHSQLLSRWRGDCELTMSDQPFFRTLENATSRVTFWFAVVVRPSHPGPLDPEKPYGVQCSGGRGKVVRYRLSQSGTRGGSKSVVRDWSEVHVPRKHRAP